MVEPPALDGARTVTELIMGDHEWFRRTFSSLDALRAREAASQELSAVWDPLAARLDLHAVAEEQIFYPQLLRVGADDPEDETLDAIDDHNDIRDGVHAAEQHDVGSDQWWDAVRAAREANDEHMAEEERDGIADFLATAPAELQHELGRRFADYLTLRTDTDGVDTSDVDPEQYVREKEAEQGVRPAGSSTRDDPSLGIGSLKGR